MRVVIQMFADGVSASVSHKKRRKTVLLSIALVRAPLETLGDTDLDVS